ncbi:hypothetical protein GCM10007108_12650 [Thermogymnomonas acidicola]|uniref:HPP family protein n=1 Tax=Thermogymnomonas acidicola TaxID=399579 RepID=A0AA37BRV4_9ARCH|nr:hypothetical protein [Thermogymnomonas acidicola]GGM76142.1 hypothetical protein GCM10007108_12650 [Thermogymnomonas acidicola]
MVRLTSDEKKYIAFIVIFATILLVTSYHSLFLLAPPFAVSTYLLTFDHGGRFSTYSSISASYLFVILTTEAIHVLLGTGTLQMLLNVVLVSLFITFLPYRHPPALALTIFSYITHSTFDFTLSSITVLLILLASRYILGHIRSYPR